MKVKDLITALSRANPEMIVCQFTESGPEELRDLGVFKGDFNMDISPKLVWGRTSGEYVGLGNPGDYKVSAPCEVCEPIKDLMEAE